MADDGERGERPVKVVVPIITRARFWVGICFRNHRLLGVWRCVLIVGSMLRLLPSKLRGHELVVTPPGGTLRLSLRVGTSDLRVFEDIFLCEVFAWPLSAPPQVIVDAGAYTGLSAAWFASTYPASRIVAIEPSDANFELLERNTQGLANVECRRAALWGETTSIDLVDPGWGPYAYRVDRVNDQIAGAAGAAETEHVDALTVPDLLDEYRLDRIDLLKIDIEGSEIEVFTDASAWIDRVGAVCLELHDRLRPGCSRVFFGAVEALPIEVRRGEMLLVVRDAAQLADPSFARQRQAARLEDRLASHAPSTPVTRVPSATS